MKKINKLFFVALASVLFVAFYSCQDDNTVVDPSTLLINGVGINGSVDSTSTQGVYFPTQEASGDHTLDPTMDKVITVQMVRTNAEGAITVPMVITASEEGIFKVGTASFADGQTETSFDIEFPDVKTAVPYTLKLEVTDPSYAYMYSAYPNFLELSVFCVEWRYFAVDAAGKETYTATEEGATTITYTQDYWGETATGKLKYYEVDGVRHCVMLTDLVHYYNGPYEGYGFFGADESPETAHEWEFDWYTNVKNNIGGQIIDLYPKVTWHNTNYDLDVSVFDWRHYWNDVNSNHYGFEFLDFASKYGDPDGSYPVCYYDGNGGFYFFIRGYYMMEYPGGPAGWGVEDWDVVGIADGFIRPDYTLEAETDFSSDGVVPVYYERGSEIDTIKYVAVGGELTAKEASKIVEAIVDGTQEGVQTVTDFSEGVLGLTFPETGLYTVVLVGFDAKGEAQSDTYVVVNYVAAGDNETYAVDIYVGTEDTPARYEGDGLDAIHSFAYYVVGKDITEAHVAVVDNSKYTANVDAYNAAVKSSDAVDDATLAAINATGGYYDVASGLAPATEYVVLVWATNGYLETIATATYTTAEDPETWHSLGTGLYTEDCVTTFFDVENLTYEVEIEESDKTPGRYRVVNPYGAAYAYNEEGDYDAGNNYYMILNAQDPEAVWMPRFDTGMDWGYSNFLIISYVGYYIENGYSMDAIVGAGVPFGTLADGVITFPKESLLIQMPGYKESWYYANSNGLFKVVLPSAYEGGTGKAPAKRVNRTITNTVNSVAKPANNFVREPQAVKVSVSTNVHPKTLGRNKPITVEKPCAIK